MDIRILGPVELCISDRMIRLGPQQRALLAMLALEAGRTVTRSRLVDLLWGATPSEGAHVTLRSHIQHLRLALARAEPSADAKAILVTDGAGYSFRIDPGQIDSVRFQRMVRKGEQAMARGQPLASCYQLRAALGMWRGPALADVADRPLFLEAITRLEYLHRAALITRVEADLELGKHSDALGDLEAMVADQPAHEKLRYLQVTAYYRSGYLGQAARACREALEAFAERGLDSPSLQKLQVDVLRRTLDG